MEVFLWETEEIVTKKNASETDVIDVTDVMMTVTPDAGRET